VGFFTDFRSHYTAGYLYGLTLHLDWDGVASKKIQALDVWAWNREWEQNLKGQNPNDPMSDHQVKEARSWGEGARKARGINPAFPSPPYPA